MAKHISSTQESAIGNACDAAYAAITRELEFKGYTIDHEDLESFLDVTLYYFIIATIRRMTREEKKEYEEGQS